MLYSGLDKLTADMNLILIGRLQLITFLTLSLLVPSSCSLHNLALVGTWMHFMLNMYRTTFCQSKQSWSLQEMGEKILWPFNLIIFLLIIQQWFEFHWSCFSPILFLYLFRSLWLRLTFIPSSSGTKHFTFAWLTNDAFSLHWPRWHIIVQVGTWWVLVCNFVCVTWAWCCMSTNNAFVLGTILLFGFPILTTGTICDLRIARQKAQAYPSVIDLVEKGMTKSLMPALQFLLVGHC